MSRSGNCKFSNNGLRVITVETFNGQPAPKPGKCKKKQGGSWRKPEPVNLLVRPFSITVCLTLEERHQLLKTLEGGAPGSRDDDDSPTLRRLPKAILGFDVTPSGRPCRVVVVPVGRRRTAHDIASSHGQSDGQPAEFAPTSGDVVIAVADHVTTQLDGCGLAKLLADHVRGTPTHILTALRLSVTLGRQVGVAPTSHPHAVGTSTSKCGAPSRSNLPVHDWLMKSMMVTPSSMPHPPGGTRPRASSLRLPPSTAAALLAKGKSASRDMLDANWSTRPIRPDDRCERRLVDSALSASKQPIAIKRHIVATLKRHLTLPNFRDILAASRKGPKPLPMLAEVDESRDLDRCPDKDTRMDAMKVNGSVTRSTPFIKWSLRRKSKTFVCPAPQHQMLKPGPDFVLNPSPALISNLTPISQKLEVGKRNKNENLVLEIKVVGVLAYITEPSLAHVSLLDQILRAIRMENTNQTAELGQSLTCSLQLDDLGFTLQDNLPANPNNRFNNGYGIPLKDVLIFNYHLTANNYDHYFGLLCKRTAGHANENVTAPAICAIKRDYWLMRTESERAIYDLKERIHQLCQRWPLPLQILESLQWIVNDAEFVRNQIDVDVQSLVIGDDQAISPNTVIKMKLEELPTFARDSSGTCDSGILMMDGNNLITNSFQQPSFGEEEILPKNYSSPSYGSLESQYDKGHQNKGDVPTAEEELHFSIDSSVKKALILKRSVSCPLFRPHAEGQTFLKKSNSMEPLVLLPAIQKKILLSNSASNECPNKSDSLLMRGKHSLTSLPENIWIKRNSVYEDGSTELDVNLLIPKLEPIFQKVDNVSSDVKYNSWGSTGRNRRLSCFMETLRGNLKPCKSDAMHDKADKEIVKCDITKKVSKRNSLAISLLNKTRVNGEMIRNSFRFSSMREKGIRRRFTSVQLPKADVTRETINNAPKPNFIRLVPNLRCSLRSFAGSNTSIALNPSSSWVSQGGNLNAPAPINSSSHPNSSNHLGPGLSMSLKSNSGLGPPGPPNASGTGGSLGTLNSSATVAKNRGETTTYGQDWFSEYVRSGVNDRIARWAVSFDNLLTDPFGLQIFTDFLVKEYSEENIEFWKDCQEYSKIPPQETDLLSSKAHSIFRKYLSDDAPNPVNVNANCRCSIKEKIGKESSDSQDFGQLFDSAQTQIYTLMRYDSYARFIKSDIYKDLVMREIEHKSHTFSDANSLRDSKLPISKSHALAHTSHDTLDDSMKKWKTNLFFSKSKLDNLLATALNRGMGLSEESRMLSKYSDDLKRRRKGLPELVPIQMSKDQETTILVDKDQLPNATNLALNNTDVKSQLLVEPTQKPLEPASTISNPNPQPPTVSLNDASVGDGLDNYLLSRYTFREQSAQPESDSQNESKVGFCTFHIRQSRPLKDEAEFIVAIEPKTGPTKEQNVADDITVKRAILHVCRLKGLEYSAVDVFTDDKEPIDLNRSLSDFMGGNVYVEQRVLFQIILLPSGKSLGVKTRPNKDLAKVLSPILEMYGIKDTNDIEIYRESDGEKILMTDDVMKIDKSTIIVCPKKGGANLRSSYENFKSNEFPFKEPKIPPSLAAGKRRPLKRSITIDIDGPPAASDRSPPQQSTSKLFLSKGNTDLSVALKEQNNYSFQAQFPQAPAPQELRMPRMSTEYFGDIPTTQPLLTNSPPAQQGSAVKAGVPNPLHHNPLLEYDPALPPYYASNLNNNNSNNNNRFGQRRSTKHDLKETNTAKHNRWAGPDPRSRLKNEVLLQTASSSSLNRRSSCSFLSGRRLSKLFLTNTFK